MTLISWLCSNLHLLSKVSKMILATYCKMWTLNPMRSITVHIGIIKTPFWKRSVEFFWRKWLSPIVHMRLMNSINATMPRPVKVEPCWNCPFTRCHMCTPGRTPPSSCSQIYNRLITAVPSNTLVHPSACVNNLSQSSIGREKKRHERI